MINYVITPLQYNTAIFTAVKNDSFQIKFIYTFPSYFCTNTVCGYTVPLLGYCIATWYAMARYLVKLTVLATSWGCGDTVTY